MPVQRQFNQVPPESQCPRGLYQTGEYLHGGQGVYVYEIFIKFLNNWYIIINTIIIIVVCRFIYPDSGAQMVRERSEGGYLHQSLLTLSQ